MKRTALLLMLLSAMALQIAAQETGMQAIYFHYKNGQSFACAADDISFITYDKSPGSEDYDIQVIYFKDNTYSEINMKQVDSVAFKDPVPKMVENGVLLDEKYEDYIIKGDTVSFTMRKDTPAGLRPKVGDVVGSTFDNAVFEDGIVARVTAVNETADGIVYSCEKADIEDFYEEIFYYGYGDIYQTNEPSSASRLKAKGDWELKGDKQLWHHEVKVTPPTLTVDDYTVGLGIQAETNGKVKMYLHKPKGGKLYARFNFSTDFEAGLNASITGRNGSSKANPIVPPITLGVIATPCPIIFFKPELQLNWYFDAFAEMKGTFKASMDYDGEIEVTLDNGAWNAKAVRNVFNAGVDEFSLSINGWYGIGIEPKIFVSLSGTKTGIGLANRTGLQLTGNLKMDFVNYLADGSLYESVKDSKLSVSLPIKGILSAQAGLFSDKVKAASLTFVTQNTPLYEGYMLPDFNYMSADDMGGGKYQATASLTPRDLLPWENVQIGFAAFDSDNRLVDKKYVDTYSASNKPSLISTTFDLASGQDYTLAPILNIFGCDIRADRATPVVPGEAVDLGLSVKWSSTNVGASQIYERGYTYQWGMTVPAYTYDGGEMNYPYMQTTMPNDISGTGYDVSTRWGEGWSMPTLGQWEELLEKCTIEAVSAIPRPDNLYPTVGVKVTGPNGNHIYIPANVGHWTATRDPEHTHYGYYVGFRVNGNQVTIEKGVHSGYFTFLIRPICSN